MSAPAPSSAFINLARSAIEEAQAIGKAAGVPRLEHRRLRPADVPVVTAAIEEFRAQGAVMLNTGMDPLEVARHQAHDLLSALGPEPSAPITKEGIAEGALKLEAKAKRAARVPQLPRIWTGSDLAEATIPPLKWIVPDLLPQGLFLLVGLFKLGKSWLVLALCLAVATGKTFLGRYHVKQGRVLYLALEDGPRRIKSRAAKMGATLPPGLLVAFDWRRGAEGVEDLRAWLEENSDISLIVIDTLSKFRAQSSNEDIWSRDYDEIAQIKKLADEFEVAIVLVHHRSKAARDDVHQTAAGTNAIQGAVDGSLLLDRKRGERTGTLALTGRDVPESEIALNFDTDTGLWTAVDGLPTNSRLTPEQVEILNLVNAQGGREIGPSEIVTLTGRAKSTASQLLAELYANGQLEKGTKRGKYRPLYTIKLTELPNSTPINPDMFGSSASFTPSRPTPEETDE